jgi:hypothetical protein
MNAARYSLVAEFQDVDAQATSRGSTRIGGDHSFNNIQLPDIRATGAAADQYPQLRKEISPCSTSPLR